MKRDELLSRLERLLPAQFEGVLFHLRIPSAQLAGVSAPQSIRAIELLRHLENTGELAQLEPLLLSYDSPAEVSKVSAQPPAAAKPVPVYPDAEVEALSKRLENARARKKRLHDSGIKSDNLDREILELRRQLREGGQLRAGDGLSDGRYLLVRVVGRGGFAVVWEAFDCTEEQRVAIKVLHANLAGDPQRLERFFRGARAMMKLTHSALVRILEPHGEDGGFYYFVMEFVPGGNLREAVLAQRVKPDDVLPLILQVGEALALVHSKGMTHRDIKPANIMLDEHGNAKLTDFDLVGVHDTTGGTRTGALGTVVYAAPECLEKPQEATARADVYGLGMTAIFCLARKELSLSTFRNPEQSIAVLDCADVLRAVIRNAVAWEPDARFADAGAMVAELRAALTQPDTADIDEEVVPDQATAGAFEREVHASVNAAVSEQVDLAQTGDGASPGSKAQSGPTTGLDSVATPDRLMGSRGEIDSRWRSARNRRLVAGAVIAVVGIMSAVVVLMHEQSGKSMPQIYHQVRAEATSRPDAVLAATADQEPPVTLTAKPVMINVEIQLSPEDAEVLIDDKSVVFDFDPFAESYPFSKRYQVDDAPHVIRASAPGYIAKSVNVLFAANIKLDLSLNRLAMVGPQEPPVTLTAKPVMINVEIQLIPEDAEVLIDGKSAVFDFDPFAESYPFNRRYQVDDATHVIRAFAPGYIAKSVDVKFAANVKLDLSLNRLAAVGPLDISLSVLDANRIAGEKVIIPDEVTIHEIARAGIDVLTGRYKVCITAEGSVNMVSLIKSTGFPAYDQKIQNTIRNTWSYRPVEANGNATPVCTAFHIFYPPE